MERIDWSIASAARRTTALARPRDRDDPAMLDAVQGIVDDVRARGWAAMTEHSERIDGAPPERIAVAPAAAAARTALPAEAQAAMALAVANIRAFHEATLPSNVELETVPGLTVAKRWRAIGCAGLYIPGGKAPLFSTLLMLAIPAAVAGVERQVVVTPPRPGGGLDPALALAAEQCGIEAIWTVGGAQAIAGLAYGAGAIERCDLICGPGNRWVSAAKALVASRPGGPGIDLPAGPSELMIIADDGADPAVVAADLLGQAEHDPAAQVLLVTPSARLIDAVAVEFDRQAKAIGGAFARARAIRCADLAEAVVIADAYAPEHLAIACSEAAVLAGAVRNAGAIFAGYGAAESFGDYLAGSSHVLPTDGAARFSSGVSTQTFMKATTVQSVSREASRRLAAPAAALARLEGLEAHARSAEARA
jgi:histidinol dehydrogenase